MADPEEKNVINGRVIPMENYGTLQNPEEDRVHILEEDELVSDLIYLRILHEKIKGIPTEIFTEPRSFCPLQDWCCEKCTNRTAEMNLVSPRNHEVILGRTVREMVMFSSKRRQISQIYSRDKDRINLLCVMREIT